SARRSPGRSRARHGSTVPQSPAEWDGRARGRWSSGSRLCVHPYRSLCVLIVPPHPGHGPGQTRLIPPLGGQIEEVIGPVEHIHPARIGRIGVIYRPGLVAIKHADTRRFFPAKLALAVVVNIFTLFGWVWGEGNLIVKIEVALERGVPRKR